MLLHEWLQYRDKRIKRLRDEMDKQTQEQAPEPIEPEAAPEVLHAEAEAPFASSHLPVQEAKPVARPRSAAAEDAASEATPVRSGITAEQQPARPGAPKTARELLEALQPSRDLRTRLEAVLARQRRLPLSDFEEEAARARRRRVVETREQLVERLLDPTLTLQEAALLLGVCPTTVRRYTNRGILKCFRTPGNQRRFKLSDILEFMERRETAEGEAD